MSNIVKLSPKVPQYLFAVWKTSEQDGPLLVVSDEYEAGRSVCFDNMNHALQVAYAIMALAGGQGPSTILVKDGVRERQI